MSATSRKLPMTQSNPNQKPMPISERLIFIRRELPRTLPPLLEQTAEKDRDMRADQMVHRDLAGMSTILTNYVSAGFFKIEQAFFAGLYGI